jgi:hemerythrin-like domain-containing protein
MLTQVGKRPSSDGSVLQRLLECHERIRSFCALARRLTNGGSDDDVRQAATELRRYFGIGLPLHVRDEEESLRPRLLRLGDPVGDEALDQMTVEHARIEVLLGELGRAWGQIVERPGREACVALHDPALELDVHMRQHLSHEERRVFPALGQLPPDQLAAIVAEMQARRR